MNPLAARLLLAAALAAEAASAQVGAAPAAPAPRFERILWAGDPAAAAATAAADGFTGVQLPRGGDPAPLRAAGLGYYLDQPGGKGVLELTDAEWRPVVAAYEASRDPAALVRPGCVAAPGRVDRLAEAAAAEARRVAGPDLRFVALADEPSATRHDAPLDTCRCADCLAAFRAFVATRYPSIDALNLAWGTQYPSFALAEPVPVDALRRRELGDVLLPRNLRPFALHRQFVDEQFAAAVAKVRAAVQAAVPGVPVGLTGLSAPAAFGGGDAALRYGGLSLAEPYDLGGARELALWLLPPTAQRYATLFPPPAERPLGAPLDRWLVAQLADLAAHGYRGAVVWNDAAVRQGGGRTAYGEALRQAFASLGPVLDACAGATVEPSSVWLLESPASVRVGWMLDSAFDGLTWTRRLASYEQTHSTNQAARLGWLRLLQDLGLQPRLVDEGSLPERLLQQRPRCLVLPACWALADRTAQAIRAYVQAGGLVLADHGTGLYDADLALRPHGALDDLFGIGQRSLRWDDLQVRDGRCTVPLGVPLPLAERGLRGELAERADGGDRQIERRTGRGRAVYLNAPVAAYAPLRLDPAQAGIAHDLRRRVRGILQQAGVEVPCEVRGQGLPTCLERVRLRLRDGRTLLVVRVHALDRPALLAELAAGGPRPVQLDLPAPAALRPLGGERREAAARHALQIDPFAGLFLEIGGP